MHELQIVNENAIVVQSNELVEANYKLSITEQKLILALASQIDTRKDDFEVVRVTAKSLSDACGFNPKGGYRQLQQTAKKILNRSIIIKNRDNNDWDGTHWVQYCKYRSVKNDDIDCSYIEVEFDKRLCPHLLNLSKKFLKSNLCQLVSFTHTYSTRFYMIFKNLVNNLPKCQKKYTFKEIMALLELPKSYEKTVDLKNKVIKVAINEINEKSDISVEYKYYSGGGRAHIGVIFTLWKKEKIDQEKNACPADELEAPAPLNSMSIYNAEETVESPKEEPVLAPAPAVDNGEKTNWTEEQQADYDLLLKIEVWAKVARQIVQTYDHARIERNYKGVINDNQKGTIANVPAVIVSAIKDDTYKGVAEEKRKAFEREQARRRAEWEERERAEKERQEQLARERAELEKLEKIRENYTAEELDDVMEKVKKDYIDNESKMTEEMENTLKKYGITSRKFDLYLIDMFKFNGKKTGKIKRKEDIKIDFDINLNDEKSIEKIIKAYYENGKKCSDKILEELEKQGLTWGIFQNKYFEKFKKIGATFNKK